MPKVSIGGKRVYLRKDGTWKGQEQAATPALRGRAAVAAEMQGLFDEMGPDHAEFILGGEHARDALQGATSAEIMRENIENLYRERLTQDSDYQERARASLPVFRAVHNVRAAAGKKDGSRAEILVASNMGTPIYIKGTLMTMHGRRTVVGRSIVDWTVTDVRTGLALASGKTRKAAIAEASTPERANAIRGRLSGGAARTLYGPGPW